MTGADAVERPWQYAVAGGLMVASPLALRLYYDRYPLAPEALALVIGGLGLGAAAGWAATRLGPWGRHLGFAGLLLVYLDQQFDLEQLVSFKVVAVACLLVGLLLRRHRAALATIVIATFDLASLGSRRPPPSRPAALAPAAAASSGRRSIVHVILDSQIGTGGLRAMGDTATARFLVDFYRSRGFDLYESAYSRFYHTRHSVPSLMSLGRVDDSTMVRPIGQSRFRLAENPYFAGLAAQGYRLDVYAPDYIDYCRTAGVVVSTCVSMPSTSSANLSYLPTGWVTRAKRVLGYHLAVSSLLAPRIVRRLSMVDYRRSAASRSLALIREATADLARGRTRPTVLFVDALVPHLPYELDATCRYRSGRFASLGGTRPPDRQAMAAEQRLRYALQVRCAHQELARLLDVVDRTYGRDGAVVLVHGDHGFRTSRFHELDSELAAATMVDVGFSALLAVRYPGGDGGRLHEEPVPLQDFVWALAEADFAPPAPTEWRHFVYSIRSRGRDRVIAHAVREDQMPWTAPALDRGARVEQRGMLVRDDR